MKRIKNNNLLIICWLLPLLLGITIFFCWVFTRNYIFVAAGYYTIILGIILLVAGTALCTIRFFNLRKLEAESEKIKMFFLILLISMNIPALFLILHLAAFILRNYPSTVWK